MHTRKLARVLPEPVGAAMSVWRPAAMCIQPCRWAAVGPSGKRRQNHSRTAGWNAWVTGPNLSKSTDTAVGQPWGLSGGESEGPCGRGVLIPSIHDDRAARRDERPSGPTGYR